MQFLKWLFYLYLLGIAGWFLVTQGPEIFTKISETKCSNKWKDSGLDAHFVLGSGCMVEVDGRRIGSAVRNRRAEDAG